MKRILSVILAVMTALTAFTGLSVSAFAAQGEMEIAAKPPIAAVGVTDSSSPALDIPAVSISNVYGGQKLSWNAVDGAENYLVCLKAGTGWKWLATTDKTEYTYQKVADRTKYTYTVIAAADTRRSEYNKNGVSLTYYAAPEIDSIVNIKGGARITWNRIAGAAKYRVFRCFGGTSKWAAIGDTVKCYFGDTKLKNSVNGKKVYYTVRAINRSGRFFTGFKPAGKSIRYLVTPTVTDYQFKGNSVRILWSKVNTAAYYCLYKKSGSGKWKFVKATVNNYWVDDAKNLTGGTAYGYAVKAVDADGVVSGCDTDGRVLSYHTAPVNIKMKNTLKGVYVTWDKTAGAAAYTVLRKKYGSNKWETVTAVTADKNAVIDSAAENTSYYSYTVRCVDYAQIGGKKKLVFTSGFCESDTTIRVKRRDSELVTDLVYSPHHSGKRIYPLTRVTVHCTAFMCTGAELGEWFANPNLEASANYGVGKDGSVGQYLPESYRSWCSSSADNDNRAITIEVSSEDVDPFRVNKTSYQTLIKLLVDICRRHGKKKLIWFGNMKKTLSYQPKSDELVMTVHRWFCPAKSCPGPYLYALHPRIAAEVTRQLAEH